MFIVPLIITGILLWLAKKYAWCDDALLLGIVICWTTYVAVAIGDVFGEWMGWWTTTVLIY